MTNIDLEKLLGDDGDDPGCDAAGEFMDAYCEAIANGGPVSARFDEFVRHMRNCVACREDTEGLIAILRNDEESNKR
jgi:hypothetical protein